MDLERRMQQSLREYIDFLVARGYELFREGDVLVLSRGGRGSRLVLVRDGRLDVIGRGGVQ